MRRWEAETSRSAAGAAQAAAVERLEPRNLFASVAATPDPSLVTWFRADTITAPAGTPLSAWADSSGRGFRATQSDPARRPSFDPDGLNGRPAVRFDADASTQFSFARPVSTDFTIVVAFGSLSGTGRGDQWHRAAGILDGDVSGIASDFGLSLDATGRIVAGTGNPDRSVHSGLGFDDGRAHVATFTRVAATGQISLYVDGRLFEQATGGTQALAAPPTLTLGSARTGTNFFTGAIGEVQIYSAALPDAARAGIESDLSEKFNIAPPPAEWYANPVINRDFPDPGAVYANNFYYAFATNGGGSNVRAARSADLVHWTALPDALPTLPSWAQGGRTWAPDVAVTAAGTYTLYYTAWHRATGRQAIGVATGSSPAGPFTPAGTGPLLTQFDRGGAIDPSVFTDATGSTYLLWKNDGNAVGQDTWIYAQQLSRDGLSLLGSPTPLIRQTLSWEGSLVEAPVLWTQGGRYYLFYSANSYANGAYATGYAVADSVLGPYTKSPAPLMQSVAGVSGPGGSEVVAGPDGDTYLLYHSWENGTSYRAMSVDELRWVDGKPVARGPSREPQPVPVRPTVVRRQVFYNDSAHDGGDAAPDHRDDAAVAPGKLPLMPGRTATFASVSSYDKGLNGVMVDIAHLPRDYAPLASDFEFRTAATPVAAVTTAAPAPASITVRRGAGVNGADRLTFTWVSDAVRNGWLRVTVKSTPRTPLVAADVFWFGSVVGKTAGPLTGLTATFSDWSRTRTALSRSPAALDSAFDFNRDGRVNAWDLAIVRSNQSRATATVQVLSTAAAFETRTATRRGVLGEVLAARSG